METSHIYLVYMTAGSKEEARSIGRMLVESRLAACVNILENMTSLYCWNGNLQEDREVVLLAKTTQDRFAELRARVAGMHSYDCPCILGFRVSDGFPPFLNWIRDSVAPEAVC
jgi:periplasmic divalent cation tolerance protein